MSRYLIYALVTIGCGGIVVGSLYFYESNISQSQHFDNTLQDFSTKKAVQAQKEEAVLSQMKDTYSAQSQLTGIVVDKVQSLTEALHLTDVYFSNPNSQNPVLILPASRTVQSNIDTLRQEINALLQLIQNHISEIKDTQTPNQTLIDEINAEIDQLRAYILALQSVVTDQTILESAQAEIEAAAQDLRDAEAAAGVVDTSGQAVIPIVTQSDIQQQQKVVDQLVPPAPAPVTPTPPPSSPVPPADNGAGNTNVSNPVYTPVQPGVSNNSDTPQLIEGANKN